MPESKLAEKLGFRIESNTVHFENSGRGATLVEVKLWKLCLELSERLADRDGLVAVIRDAGYEWDESPTLQFRMFKATLQADRVIAWLAADPERKDA